jgi:hypothetical protein
VNHCRGHRVVGGFGHGGQDSFWFLGARDPDRLLLLVVEPDYLPDLEVLSFIHVYTP